VGLTEEQVKARGIPYVTGVYPFTGNGRAKCFGDTEGMVKLIATGRPTGSSGPTSSARAPRR